jgi:hypothetical protein
MTKLKQNIKDIYQEKMLNDKQLDELFTLQDKGRKSFFSYLFTRPLITSCAVLFICFISIFTYNQQGSLEERILQEIAYNHNKQMQPELMTKDLAEVQGFLKSLNFALVDSSKLKKLALVGGRYCSIQGKVAAQLKYKSASNKASTIYQTVLPKKLNTKYFKEYQGSYQGVHVKMWHEKGILFGIATSDTP